MVNLQNVHSRVEQLVARRAHNPEVGGPSPPPVILIVAKSQFNHWTFVIYLLLYFSFNTSFSRFSSALSIELKYGLIGTFSYMKSI